VVDRQEGPTQPEGSPPLALGRLRGKQYEGQDRRRALFPERGRQADADPQGPTSAGLAIFHPQADRTDWRALISGKGQGLPLRLRWPYVRCIPDNCSPIASPDSAALGQELTSTGVPTGIERQKRLVRYCRGYLRPSACVVPLNWP